MVTEDLHVVVLTQITVLALGGGGGGMAASPQAHSETSASGGVVDKSRRVNAAIGPYS